MRPAGQRQAVPQPSLVELWSWAVYESTKARREVPLAIHAQGGDRDDWGSAGGELIRGLPFTRAFEAYVDGDLLGVPIARALRTMRPGRRGDSPEARSARLQYRVCLAIVVDGELEPEQVRRRLGLSDFAFATAALHGLLGLKKATEHEYVHRSFETCPQCRPQFARARAS